MINVKWMKFSNRIRRGRFSDHVFTSRSLRSIVAVAFLILAGPFIPASVGAAEAHYLIDNCSSEMPASGPVRFSVDQDHPKVGLGALKAEYGFSAGQRNVDVQLPEHRWVLPMPGKFVLWVKGDGSANELELNMFAGHWRTEPDGRRNMVGVQNVQLPRIKLDSKEWKEITLDASAEIPVGNLRWINHMRILRILPTDKKALAAVPETYEGSFELDDLRMYPLSGQPSPGATVSTALLGSTVRDFTNRFTVCLDARNFTSAPAKMKVRLSMSDRNQNAVADRDYDVALAADEAKEFKLEMAPENIGLYLPPFHITGDVTSTDVPALASHIDVNVVMANSRILFDNLADVNGRWLTRGYVAAPPGKQSILQDTRNWVLWTMGEACRAVAWTQTSAKLTRVTIDRPAGADAKSFPPDRYAMKFDYNGEAVAYTGFERYFPGNAFKFGVWVKGDGSNNQLIGNFLDYSDLSDFWYGGWKRTYDSTRVICRLNFTDWRYFEVPLPGNGIGTNLVRGSTDDIDMPIELTALAILPDPIPAKPDPNKPLPVQSGTVLIGAMFADTQQAAATTLAAMVGYDDAYLDYGPKHNAHVSVQNAWRVGSRKIEANWTLADKENQPIVTGKQELEIPAGAIRTFDIDLASHAAEIGPRPGPLRLQVTASDKQDLNTSVTREIDLAKPDSTVLLADFESDRGYFGTKVEGITNAPPKGEPAAHTSAAEHHSGKRALEIKWDREKNLTRYVAVDPPIPGVSVELTLWVKGDGSGALFYPLIGGPPGVRAGLGTRNWNVFIPRVEGGELQDAVRLDFTDWRKFTFHFTPISPNFDKPLPVLHFLPSYPQGLHLGIDAREAKGDGGSVFVDDISIRTHLEPSQRMGFTLRRDSEANTIRPDAHLTFVASNYDAAATRHGVISGGVYDWRGSRVAKLESAVDLKPGEVRDVVLHQTIPSGAYELRVQMKEADHLVSSITQDLLVIDVEKVLGADWQEALKDEWKLRVPIKNEFTYLDEDWDWIEYFPGNIQTDSMRNRFDMVKANKAKPWMLLGFSALWASGTGYEQMKAGAFFRVFRHSGQGVDIFLVPARDEDWETYVIEVMRGVGKDISGWVLWDNPDGTSSLALTPKRLSSFIRIADKWRQVYCPKTPLIIGGMARATAIPYLEQLAKEDVLSHISGVNVRMDVGRMSPEDSQVLAYVNSLREALSAGGKEKKRIVLTELDWAVEKTASGLNVFDQAAYLARAELLLSRAGVKPALNIRNEDYERLGTGLAYRSELQIPPMTEKPLTFNLKPAWWAMLRTRELLAQLKPLDMIAVQDLTPERTLAMLFERKSDGKGIVIVWRNDEAASVSFEHTGLSVAGAQDIFGAPVPAEKGWYGIGKVPVVFSLTSAGDREGLTRLWVRDSAQPTWSQRVLAQFAPASGKSVQYEQKGGTEVMLSGRTATGAVEKAQGVTFASAGSESFTVKIPVGSGLILRKRYFLDKAGQSAKVMVNGKLSGAWDLKRSEAALSEGIREAIYIVDSSLLAGRSEATIRVEYDAPANTLAWTALEYAGGDFPLPAVGPVHADQQVGPIRLGRNMVGGQIKVDTETFASGIGAFANSLLEYPLNRQFKRFSTKVGVDAATEGRGSVVFEVWADGKKLWSSGIMSGLDRAKTVDLDVSGVNRLRLIVNDAGDGNKFDAGDWCEPVLKR